MAKKKTASPSADSDADPAPDLAAFVEQAHEQSIDMLAIDPSPYQTRQRFDADKLQTLAGSLQKHGQLQNLIVREVGGRYELICGERRWRAGCIAGLLTMRALVIDCDDDAARELVIIENLERENVSAIEEAAGFEQLLQSGRYNQTSLAERLGCHPSHISNRLRLLKLPDFWRQRIVDGQLPPTHARALVPWIDRPAVLEQLMVAVTDPKANAVTSLSVEEWEQSIESIVRNLSRDMTPGFWNGPRFEVTPEILEQLDVADVRQAYSDKKSPRAFNVTLWDELQQQAEEVRAKAREREEAERSDVDEESTTPVRPPDRSDLSDWKLERAAGAHISAVLAGRIKPDAMCLRIFLATLIEGQEADFLEWLHTKDAARTSEDDHLGLTHCQLWGATADVTVKNLPGLIAEFLQARLAEDHTSLSLELLLTICRELSIEPFAKWQPDEKLLELCSDNQLRELFRDEMAPEKSVKKWGRDRLIKEALSNWPAGYLPPLLTPRAMMQPTTIGAGAADDGGDPDEEEAA